MSGTVRVIVLNADEDAAPELRAHLLSVNGVKIVAEIDEPSFLAQALDQFPAEVLLVHLDPNPPAMMDVVAPLIEARKGRFASIAMTESRDAELVVRAMRAGMKEFLWKPFPPEQLNEILIRIGKEVPAGSRRMGRLIPIMGTSGGVGATTLATNVAVELVQLEGHNGGAGKPKVVLVDLDFRFGQVAMLLDAQPTYTIAELCESPEQLETQMIERAVVKLDCGLHVLAHPADFEQAARITAAQTAGVLAALQEHYDYVIVDGPVRLDPTAQAVFDMTDIYVLVLQLLVPAVRNADRILQEMARNGYNPKRIRLVCNRYGREAGYLAVNDVETTLGRKFDFWIPDDWKTSCSAVNMGSPLIDYAPKTKLRLAYKEFAKTLIADADENGTGEREEARSEKKGLFSFFAGQKA